MDVFCLRDLEKVAKYGFEMEAYDVATAVSGTGSSGWTFAEPLVHLMGAERESIEKWKLDYDRDH